MSTPVGSPCPTPVLFNHAAGRPVARHPSLLISPRAPGAGPSARRAPPLSAPPHQSRLSAASQRPLSPPPPLLRRLPFSLSLSPDHRASANLSLPTRTRFSLFPSVHLSRLIVFLSFPYLSSSARSSPPSPSPPPARPPSSPSLLPFFFPLSYSVRALSSFAFVQPGVVCPAALVAKTSRQRAKRRRRSSSLARSPARKIPRP